MELEFPIDHKSGVPIYVQIMNHVKHLIATGVLTPGQQLPTIRQLAVDITVNLNTVAHAYAELEREGLLTIQRGRGTFIAEPENGPDLTEMRDSKLQTLVDNLFTDALGLGYSVQEVQRAVADQMQAWQRSQGGK
ncbi:MAG: GntR family transcriptional regulator [Anaerolineae bacterium]|nr:MAG: GntR family transcriptional regulator [Anaerolineae bacterium]